MMRWHGSIHGVSIGQYTSFILYLDKLFQYRNKLYYPTTFNLKPFLCSFYVADRMMGRAAVFLPIWNAMLAPGDSEALVSRHVHFTRYTNQTPWRVLSTLLTTLVCSYVFSDERSVI